ncbi:MAG: class I tRNA ligase family protein, partial [Actinomycetota bacterium]|nr:class I tRNA ligase family protein [Actinomycetota bacterium]
EAYRRIRNTLRFLLGNLYDFRPAEDTVPPEDMEELDRWILSRLQRLVRRCTQAMDAYQLHVVFHALHNFCAVDLSALYLDMRKDCLYTFAADSRPRRSSQTALWKLLRTMTMLMAPILCHTAEEVWQVMRGDGDPESVQLADWPEVEEGLEDAGLEEIFDHLLRLREQVTKAIEEKRTAKELGTSLEAMVRLTLPGSWKELVEPRKELLATLFIVSRVEVDYGEGEEVRVEVGKAPGSRCSRCWNYRPSVGRDSDHPELCDRCLPVVLAAEG